MYIVAWCEKRIYEGHPIGYWNNANCSDENQSRNWSKKSKFTTYKSYQEYSIFLAIDTSNLGQKMRSGPGISRKFPISNPGLFIPTHLGIAGNILFWLKYRTGIWGRSISVFPVSLVDRLEFDRPWSITLLALLFGNLSKTLKKCVNFYSHLLNLLL